MKGISHTTRAFIHNSEGLKGFLVNKQFVLSGIDDDEWENPGFHLVFNFSKMNEIITFAKSLKAFEMNTYPAPEIYEGGEKPPEEELFPGE